jgi:aminopeptidase N
VSDVSAGPAEEPLLPDDPHSHARAWEVAVRHLSLDLEVDFESRRLGGSVRFDLDRHDAGATELVLDTWQLEVLDVTLADGTQAAYELGESDPLLGSALTIQIGAADSVVVHYRTHPDARALQWLEPEQTSSGQPFLFTQSQAILARSWVPLQDSPSVRFSYDATVRVPPALLALMSAVNPTGRTEDGVHRFTMPQRVPSYLMALAVGDLEFRSTGPRSGVYAEPSVVDAAAWEFADTEEMIDAVQRRFGRYRWDRYDVLVAPASFPFGGMENPRLTFLTPTLLAGDRSLVSVVAHELAHSWSGNLVTNATWNDVWLNEGFTEYLETRIVEDVYGERFATMILQLYRQELLAALPDLDPRDTWLEQDLAGRDADEGASPVAYHKGSLFLSMLEQAVGRERLDAFLTAYFDRYAFRSMDTPSFVQHLRMQLLEPAGITAEDVRLEAWVHGPGLPDNAPVWHSEAFAAVDRAVAALLAGGPASGVDVDGWSPHEWIHLLRALPEGADGSLLDDLDETFGLSESRNSEILFTWLRYAVRSGHVFDSLRADRALADFLERQGRIKFLRPLYAALVETEGGKERAREIYAVARPGYHAVAAGVVDRILDRA